MPLSLISESVAPSRAIFTIPSSIFADYSPHASALRAGLQDLIQKLPPLDHLLLACHRGRIAEIENWLPRCAYPTTVVPVDDDIDFSLWSQDIALCVRDRSTKELLLLGSTDPIRRADATVVAGMARAAGLACHPAAFRFEAGNVLAGDNFVLLGQDICRDMTAQQRSPPSLVAEVNGTSLAEIAEGRTIVFVGTAQPVPVRSVRLRKSDAEWYVEEIFAGTGGMQPIFHLDMFVSLGGLGADGRFRILVGDTRVAAESIDGAGGASLPPHFLSDELDEVAEQLRARPEFHVSRNPLPLIYNEETGLLRWSRASIEREFDPVAGGKEVIREMQRRDIRKVTVRRWYFATQNNVITYRDRDGQKNVLIPTYAYGKWRGLANLERRNAAIWADLGYGVTPLANFNAFTRAHGSARCLVKLLP